MNNPPSFQFYPRDWLADSDVRLMTFEQRGIYLELLCFCWEKDGLTTDINAILSLLHLTKKSKDRVLPVLQRFTIFITETGDRIYHHKRFIEAKLKYSEKSEKSSEAARRRWELYRESKFGNADAQPTHCERNAIIADADANAKADSNSKGGAGGNPKPPPLELPEWLEPEAWQRFCAYRKKKHRAAFTRDAEQLNLRELTKLHEQGNDPVAVIEQTIARGWSGLFEIKQQSDTGRTVRKQQLGFIAERKGKPASDEQKQNVTKVDY